MAAGGELGYGAGAGTSMRGLAAIVAFALLVGGAVGVGAALLSGGGRHDRGASSATTPGSSGQSQPLPAIPGLRTIADPRHLRSKPHPHPVESSGTTSVSKSESVVTPSTSQPSSAPTPSSSSGGGETSTHVTPPHSEGGTVHSESGGGA